MSCWCCKYVRWFESMTPPGPPKHWWAPSWWSPTAMWTRSEARPLLRLSTRALEAVRIIIWTCSIKRPRQKQNRNGSYNTSTATRVSAAAPPSLLFAWQEYRPKSPGLTIRVCLRREPKWMLWGFMRTAKSAHDARLTFALFSCCPWLWPPLPFSIQPLVWANLCKKVVFCFNVSGDSNVEQVFSCS